MATYNIIYFDKSSESVSDSTLTIVNDVNRPPNTTHYVLGGKDIVSIDAELEASEATASIVIVPAPGQPLETQRADGVLAPSAAGPSGLQWTSAATGVRLVINPGSHRTEVRLNSNRPPQTLPIKIRPKISSPTFSTQ